MKILFTLINIFLVGAMAYLCVDMVYQNILLKKIMVSDEHLSTVISKDITLPSEIPVLNRGQYDVITKRNLFKVDIEEKETPPQKEETKNEEPEKLEVTNLKLVLWGTVTGGSELYAVIEDKKVRQQSLYQVGDSIQGATLKKILRQQVILTFQGKDQILEMQTDRKNGSNRNKGKFPRKMMPEPVAINRAMINDSLDNMGAVMKQIKFRPHFTEGEPDGLMVYGIRPNSIFRKIGLRNGDIIRDINGTSIESAEDASSLFSELQGAETAKVTLFRRGKVKELVYQLKEDSFSTEAVPETYLMKSKGDE